MILRCLICWQVWLLLATSTLAAPQVQFVLKSVGTSTQWDVSVRPDVESFVANTSLAVELDIQFTNDVTSATLNSSFWNVKGVNTGNNPFTGTVTEGLVVDTTNDTIFVSAGSELYAAATPMLLMTVETAGPLTNGVVIAMGGRPVLPGTLEAYTSSRIAQNGVNFDGIDALVSLIVEPISGDFDASGAVGNSDLTLLLDNWGEAVPPVPAGWYAAPPTAPSVDNDELTILLDAWGDATGAAAAVPEPTSLLVALIGICLLGTGRRAGFKTDIRRRCR